MRPLYFCLATDDNYVPLASVSIESILQNNKNNTMIHFFILDSGISDCNKKILKEQIEKYKARIEFIDVSKELKELENNGAKAQGSYKSYAAYSRFFLIDKLPDFVDKILYIDCDTCILNNLEELFNIDLENNVIGAVIDILPAFHKEKIGFNIKDKYFNSGVLLFNCRQWKEQKILLKIKTHLKEINNRYSFHDQDIINIVCKNKIKTLPPQYMVFLPEYLWGKKRLLKFTDLSPEAYYDDEQLKQAINNPCIIHYVNSLFGRPWFLGNNNKYAKDWKNYMELSPFSDNYPYEKRKISIKHKVFEKLYFILPKGIFLPIFKKRKYKVLLKRENEK